MATVCHIAGNDACSFIFLCDISDNVTGKCTSFPSSLPDALYTQTWLWKQVSKVSGLMLVTLSDLIISEGVWGISICLFHAKICYMCHQFVNCKVGIDTYLLGRGILRDEGDFKVGAYQLPPKVILAAFSTDAFPHKVHFINYNLPW